MPGVHRWNIAVVGCLTAGALLLGCAGPKDEDLLGTEPTQDFPYREKYADYGKQVQEQLDSGRCKVDFTCGDLAFVNCRIEVDGPGYYIHSPTGTVLEVCGGACMFGPYNGFCMQCPPPEWSCKQ